MSKIARRVVRNALFLGVSGTFAAKNSVWREWKQKQKGKAKKSKGK